MRRGRPYPNLIGLIMVTLGVIIIFSMILPSGFWWFALGTILIVLGLCWSKRK